jgi:hypothetical protein
MAGLVGLIPGARPGAVVLRLVDRPHEDALSL